MHADHFVNCEFHLLRRLDIETKVWKAHCEARESNRLEYRWEKLIWR